MLASVGMAADFDDRCGLYRNALETEICRGSDIIPRTVFSQEASIDA